MAYIKLSVGPFVLAVVVAVASLIVMLGKDATSSGLSLATGRNSKGSVLLQINILGKLKQVTRDDIFPDLRDASERDFNRNFVEDVETNQENKGLDGNGVAFGASEQDGLPGSSNGSHGNSNGNNSHNTTSPATSANRSNATNPASPTAHGTNSTNATGNSTANSTRQPAAPANATTNITSHGTNSTNATSNSTANSTRPPAAHANATTNITSNATTRNITGPLNMPNETITKNLTNGTHHANSTNFKNLTNSTKVTKPANLTNVTNITNMSNTTNNTGRSNGTCFTREDPRVSSLCYTTAKAGTPCKFGLDERDEGWHCIMDDRKYGSLGWCYTEDDLGEWGACDSGCPLFGQEQILGEKLDKLEDLVSNVSKALENFKSLDELPSTPISNKSNGGIIELPAGPDEDDVDDEI